MTILIDIAMFCDGGHRAIAVRIVTTKDIMGNDLIVVILFCGIIGEYSASQ